jgi:hypothetical protein
MNKFRYYAHYSTWIPIISILLRLLNPATADLSYVILLFYSSLGRMQSIQSMYLIFIYGQLNPALAPSPVSGPIFMYVTVFITLLFELLFRYKNSNANPQEQIIKNTLMFCVFLFLHSYLYSSILIVSLLKAIFWTATMSILIYLWSQLNSVQTAYMDRWLIRCLSLNVLLSVPFLFIPSIGYQRNGTGFQGIFNHPQVFGPVMAITAAILFGIYMERRKPSLILLLFIFTSLYFLYLSESRTALGALLVGVSLSILYVALKYKASIDQFIPAIRNVSFRIIIFSGLIILFYFSTKTSVYFNEFLTKKGGAEAGDLVEAYQVSRGTLIDMMIENIKEKPLTGIGFSNPSSPDMITYKYDPFFNLPYSASMEKGVLPLAVLEEIGIAGFIFFAFWVINCFKIVSRRGVAAIGVFTVSMFLNLGECVFFSPGGLGMLMIIGLSWGLSRQSVSSDYVQFH